MSRNDYIGNIRTFETANFRISIDAEYDYDTDLSFDDSGDVLRKIESGDLIAFQVSATVTHKPTGTELAADYLGGCIYESIQAFQDHRLCGVKNHKSVRREGRFQIYRTNRKYKSCLGRDDKLKKRGFATRERAESWAKTHAKEPWEIFPTGQCGSCFSDMIHAAITEARKQVAKMTEIRLRKVSEVSIA